MDDTMSEKISKTRGKLNEEAFGGKNSELSLAEEGRRTTERWMKRVSMLPREVLEKFIRAFSDGGRFSRKKGGNQMGQLEYAPFKPVIPFNLLEQIDLRVETNVAVEPLPNGEICRTVFKRPS